MRNIVYMRTTIRLQDSILRDAKKRALAENKSLTALIEESLQNKLYNLDKKPIVAETLPTFKGSGVRSGVNLNNSQNLLDTMDGIQ